MWAVDVAFLVLLLVVSCLFAVGVLLVVVLVVGCCWQSPAPSTLKMFAGTICATKSTTTRANFVHDSHVGNLCMIFNFRIHHGRP